MTISPVLADGINDHTTATLYFPRALTQGKTRHFASFILMEADDNPWPEPVPDWPQAKQTWSWFWPFHIYFFTVLYCLVIIRGFYVLVTQGKAYFRNKNHRFFMNLLLLAFGTLRLVFFIWDPYGSDPDHTKVELVVCIITFGIGTACLTSAFSVLLLIVLESTRISLAPSKFQNRSFLLGVYAMNVLYVVVSDLVVAHLEEAKVLILICQITFALWGILIASGYASAAFRLWRNLKASRHASQYDPSLAVEGKKVTKLVTLLCLASACGVVLFSTIVYSALGDTGVLNDAGEVSNWPWIAVQTLLRGCEAFISLFIFLIALRTNSSSRTQHNRVDRLEIKSSPSEEKRYETSVGCAV